MKVQVIIPTAGVGERMKAEVPKPFLAIAGRSVIAHTLKAFEDSEFVHSVILVGHFDSLENLRVIVKVEGFQKVSHVVLGGATRTQSVRNGLKALDLDTDIVMVHDGVRPLVTAQVIEDSVKLCVQHGAVVVAVPVKPTLKVVDSRTHLVRETLDRTLVWEIQTPQVFKREIILKAYQADANATDDAALVENAGFPVKVCMGDYRNIKITTPEDLVIAEALLKG